ncbi:MAG: hypothetical protein AB7S80_19800 [Rhizobiaceae bacterium]
MCFDPVTLLTAAGLSSQAANTAAIAGTALSAAGTFAQIQGQAAAAKASAAAADENAKAAMAKGNAEADRIEDKYQRLRATGRTSAAKAGVNPDVGSAGLINEETSANQFLDTATTIWNARTEASAYGYQAKVDRANAKALKTSAPIAAGGTFLTGVGSLPRSGVRLD